MVNAIERQAAAIIESSDFRNARILLNNGFGPRRARSRIRKGHFDLGRVSVSRAKLPQQSGMQYPPHSLYSCLGLGALPAHICNRTRALNCL
jgi:hypothetical protein